MGQRNTSRAIVLLTLVAVSICMLVPTVVSIGNIGGGIESLPKWYTKIFKQKMNLGLDLQGGILLQYKVQVDKALERKAVQVAATIEDRLLEEAKVKAVASPRTGVGLEADELTTIDVVFESEESADVLGPSFLRKHLPDYSVSRSSGKERTIQMRSEAIQAFRRDSVEQAIETIERRINLQGVAESTVSKRGETNVVVQLPGIKEEDYASKKATLAQTGVLHFQIVDDNPSGAKFFEELGKRKPTEETWPEGIDKAHTVVVGDGFARSTSRELLEHMAKGLVDREHLIGFEEIFVNPQDPTLRIITSLNKQQEQDLRRQSARKAVPLKEMELVRGYKLWFMFKKAGMGGENVIDAAVGYDQFGKPEVNMTFAKVDADQFYEMTKKYTKEAMAIMIDEMVKSAPVIQGPIPGGNVRITLGGGSQVLKEAQELAVVLKSGALQAPLTNEYDSQVGPSLGADSISAGQTAIVWGLSLVILFMLIYYRGSGFVADIALILNVVFVLAGLTMFGATLTLPGIAGIVLTVGMAVDANVLIFERIREELRSGRSVRQAIDAGYEKAFSAILDANVTTGLAAIVLYQFGSGPIRGFAVTLGIGIVCSMYTALVVTRLIFERMYGRGAEPRTMSI